LSSCCCVEADVDDDGDDDDDDGDVLTAAKTVGTDAAVLAAVVGRMLVA